MLVILVNKNLNAEVKFAKGKVASLQVFVERFF